MARKRNEEYIGEDDDGEFEEEPFESYEDEPDFVDEVPDEGESHESKNVEGNFRVVMRWSEGWLALYLQVVFWMQPLH